MSVSRSKIVLIGVCASFAVASCSDDKAESVTTEAPAIDADGFIGSSQSLIAAIQDIVLAAGEDALDSEALAGRIKAAYPNVIVSGYAFEADPSTISLYINLPNDKNPAGADNPWVVAVAVTDTSGICTGGAVHGFPLPTELLTIENPAACNAGSVLESVDEQI